MMQGARRDTSQFGDLFDSKHGATFIPDVTLMSRVSKNTDDLNQNPFTYPPAVRDKKWCRPIHEHAENL